MGLFNRKKNTEEKKTSKAVVKKTTAKSETKSVVTKGDSAIVSSEVLNILEIISGPRVSEKAAVVASSANAYVFNVSKTATKPQIAASIEKIYKVVPVKVTVAKVPSKKVQIRGQRGKTGVRGGGRKAFVFLKKGDKIELI